MNTNAQVHSVGVFEAGGATLSIFSRGPQPDPGALARNLAQPATKWNSHDPRKDPGPSRVAPIELRMVGADSFLLLALTEGTTAAEGLWSLENAHPGLITPRLALVCLVAAEGFLKRWSPERQFYAYFLAMQVPFEWEKPRSADALLSNDQLEKTVAVALTPDRFAEDAFVLPSLHPVDVARAQFVLAEQLWRPPWMVVEALFQISMPFEGAHAPHPQLYRRWMRLAATGSFGVHLRNDMHVTVAGATLQIANEQDVQWCWREVAELFSRRVPRETIRALIPDQRLTDMDHLWEDIETDGDPAILLGLAVGLVRDAQTHAAFAPEGTFDVVFPDGLGLREFRMTGMRLAVHSDGFYWRTLNPELTGPINTWSPRWITPDHAEELLHFPASEESWRLYTAWVDVVCSALWHDLHVAGEQSFRPRRKRSRGRQQADATLGVDVSSTAEPQAEPKTIVLDLPRRLILSGSKDWGTPDEHHAIQKAAAWRRGPFASPGRKLEAKL